MKYRKHIILISLLLLLIALSVGCILYGGCGGYHPHRRTSVNDYYGEFSFMLPFKYINEGYVGYLRFNVDYSIEEMCDVINDAGYKAELFNRGDIKTILVSVKKGEFTYYFVIADKGSDYVEDVYTLDRASYYLYRSPDNITGGYSFLAPTHIIEKTDDNSLMRVYASFDYIADFYRVTGKDDFEIDEQNSTVIFKLVSSLSEGKMLQRNINLRYIEREDGSYLKAEYELIK